MKDYFEHVHTVEEIKKKYRRLAMLHHPDRGGSVDIMQEINRQYQEALRLCDRQTNDEGFTYYYDETVESKIMDTIDSLLKLRMDDVEINLIGVWIWITGETKPYKEQLKGLKCRWHSKRVAWYWHNQKRRTKRSEKKLAQIAEKYGCRNFTRADDSQEQKIAIVK